MDLQEFLAYALTSTGAGVLTFGVVQYVDHLRKLSPDVKFWGAIVLSWVIPALAYVAQVLLGLTAVSAEGIFLVASIGYMVSQAVHKVTQ